MSKPTQREPGNRPLGSVIRRNEALALPVAVHHWEGGEIISNGRLLRHLPSGCVFAVVEEAGEVGAWLVDGQQDDETEELGGMAIGYLRLVGQGLGPTFRRSRR